MRRLLCPQNDSGGAAFLGPNGLCRVATACPRGPAGVHSRNTAGGIYVMRCMSENNHYHDVLNDLNPQHRALRRMIPDVYRGFAEQWCTGLRSLG